MFYDEHTNMTELELRALAGRVRRYGWRRAGVVLDEFVHTIRETRKAKYHNKYRFDAMQVGNSRTRTLKRYRCPKRC